MRNFAIFPRYISRLGQSSQFLQDKSVDMPQFRNYTLRPTTFITLTQIKMRSRIRPFDCVTSVLLFVMDVVKGNERYKSPFLANNCIKS